MIKKIIVIVLLLVVATMCFGQDEATKISFEPSVPGALYYAKDKRLANLQVSNVPKGISNVVLNLSYTDAFGKSIDVPLNEVTLNANENFKKEITLPFVYGYVKVNATGNFNGKTKDFSFSYAVIPSNYLDYKAKDSRFGVNCHFNQGWDPFVGKIVKRAGIEYIRDGEADLNDKAIGVAIDNKLNYMPCFTGMGFKSINFAVSEIEKGKTYKDKWDFSPYIKDYGEYAKRYGNYIDYYDIANEPNNTPWIRFGAGWYGGEWIPPFVKWGSQVSSLIKKNDKNAKLVWEDLGPMLWFRQFLDAGISKKSIDVISPHPYNLHRNSPYPEDTEQIEDYALYREFCKDNNWNVLPVFVGELGFSSYDKAGYANHPFYTSNTELEQANMLVRVMTLHFVRGIDKFFWYDMKNDGIDKVNPEHNFGLINYDFTPKPSIVAYANFINKTRNAKWLGRYSVGAACQAYVFLNNDTGKATIVAWSKDVDKDVFVQHIKSDTKTLEVSDIFGNKKETLKIDERKLMPITLTNSPVYIENMDMKDMQYLIAKYN